MKVAFVNGTPFWGGGEKWFVMAASYLRDRGHEIHFYASCDEVADRVKDAGLNVYKLGFRSDIDIFTVFGLYRSFKKIMPDVVLYNAERDVRLGGPAAIWAGISSRVHIKGISGIKNNRRYRWSYSKLRSHTLCVAEAVRREILDLGWVPPERLKTIHNGVDIDKFVPEGSRNMRKKIGAADGDPVVGAVARLSSIKGFEYLIDAMPAVLDKYPSAKCMLVGKGRIEEDLKQRVAELGLEKSVIFPGFTDDPADAIRSLDVMAHPSVHTEGLPYSLLETMACGVPAIGTPVAGIPEAMVEGETGLIVPKRDSKALADAIIELTENPDRRKKMGEAARKRAVEHFNQADKMAQFEAWLKELAEDK